ncbi:MAG: clan AA aspartic protease [Novosphingobium sp.]|nr:clan AA aspartic protease [Novosphingobium sp.]
MGIVHALIGLANARDDSLQPMEVNALVDSGALHLCIPQHIANQLKLEKQSERAVTLADGREQTVDYVGPVTVSFEGRKCLTGALVLGNEALLGAIPMEDMDLVIHPSRQNLSVNPASPNIPMSLAKGLQR